MNGCGMTLRASCILSACLCLITSLVIFIVVGIVGAAGNFNCYRLNVSCYYSGYSDQYWTLTVMFFFLQFVSNPILIVGAVQESSSAILVWLCLQSIHIAVLILFVLVFFIYLLAVSLWGLSVAVILPGILVIGIDIVFVITAGRAYNVLKNGGSLIPRTFVNNVEYAPPSVRSNNLQRSNSFVGQNVNNSRQDLQWRRGGGY